LPKHPALIQSLVCGVVILWSVWVSSLVVYRMWRFGSDSRFDHVKHEPLLFFAYWNVLAVWVCCALLPMLLLFDARELRRNDGVSAMDCVGLGTWVIGYVIEATSDIQKYRFKHNKANEHKFISTGLWSTCRHPNYFGDILMWWGVFVSSLTTLQKESFFHVLGGLLCPLSSMMFLGFISGIPILESQAKRRWSRDPAYQRYQAQTPLIIPYVSVFDRFLRPQEMSEEVAPGGRVAVLAHQKQRIKKRRDL